MADIQQRTDMTKVDAQDILADRQYGWDFFLRAASWGIGVVAVLLVVLYAVFG